MKITENDIELWAIGELGNLGWKYIHGAVIAPDGEEPERCSFSDVILKRRLQEAIARNNPEIPFEAQQEALKKMERISSPELMVNNQKFHELLTEGVPVEYRRDLPDSEAGNVRGDRVQLIDFENPQQNDFLVVNQFTIIENNNNKRPDLILFINGLPLVLFELKNAIDENATLHSAFNQIQTYKETIPSLFTYNTFCVLSDGADAKAGSLSAGYSRYLAWWAMPVKHLSASGGSDGIQEASTLTGQLEVLIKGLANPPTLLDYIRHFIVFEEDKHIDLPAGVSAQAGAKGIANIQTIKKVAAYHQYYAVNKAIESVKQASSDNGDRKGGVVWHTQGSGKSLSMVFFSGKLVLQLNNPTILVITDRNDLDDQLFDTFGSSKQLLRQVPIQAESREHLKELLKVASGGIVFATIQKFQPDDGSNVYEQLSDRTNIVVVADEAHRTQYDFKPKTIDVKDDNDNVVGQRLVYGFAKYMRDALPNATYLGFTGTPVESTDANTPAVFGNYVDIYDIAQAVEDGATVPIYYESRNLSEEGKQLIEELDEELEKDELTDTQKAKAKWTKVEAIIGSEARLKKVAEDIVFHYEERTNSGIEGKAMIVTMSRQIAVDLYSEIIKIRPHWHNDDQGKGVLKVVMTASSSDGPDMMKHHTSKDQRRALADRMKDNTDPMKLVIVRDMWLTGFDAPSMHTLYIDKPMKGHNLMQAIARVNRVYKDPGGLVVDYFGITSDLKKALSFYSDSGGKGDPAEAQEKAVQLMLEKLEVVSQMFSENDNDQHMDYAIAAEPDAVYKNGLPAEALAQVGFAYEDYFDAALKQKLEIIIAAVEHILSLADGKNRYVREVTALSKAFAIALPHDEAMDAKDELAFYDAVAANESAKDLLGDEVLLKLARVLVERVKANATIDWTVKESIKKKLKVIVKRTLRQYGYPPDLQKLATDTVLQQAEALADFWSE